MTRRSGRRIAIRWDNTCLVIEKAAAAVDAIVVVMVVVMVVYVGADASERGYRE